VGGGPNLENNQVAIESNVRYLNRLLPQEIVRTTLFADGNVNNATVLADIDTRKMPIGERLLRLALQDRDSSEASQTQFRKPHLGGRLDGPTKSREVAKTIEKIALEAEKNPKQQLFAYFTGHGSSDNQGDENNVFDMWGNEALTVRDMAKHIARLPAGMPVTLVMVQCHSGSFANLIFEGGDPRADVADRDIVGYFAAIKERPAAGCTSEVNEEEYRDFTSYFFAALTGVDRLGRKVTGADYNGDGRVGMDEAYCYTLAQDRSIDVPVCTSDIFLRRFVTISDTEVFRTPYSQIVEWATPGQKAALAALTKALGRETGEDRLQTAYREMRQGKRGALRGGEDTGELRRQYVAARQEGRRTLFARFPALSRSKEGGLAYKRALEEAKRYLTQEANEAEWRRLLAAEESLERADSEEEKRDIAESHLIRLVRLGKSVVLARKIRQSGDKILLNRYERLVKGESASLLPALESLPHEEAQSQNQSKRL
jgi:hypothetical protein